MTYLEAYHLGLALVKKAGFELAQVSKISETCYYTHPARRPYLLRVSTHTSKRGPMGLQSNTLARATFSRKDTHEFSEMHVNNVIAMAIGRYFIGDPKPSNYYGRKGTWEHSAVASGTQGASDAATSSPASGC